jgi:hypothetical protein
VFVVGVMMRVCAFDVDRSAPTPALVFTFLRGLFPNARVSDGYGITEVVTESLFRGITLD